ncbi:MAG: 50S ribosomal protein L25 [Phycisphaeraceae bacterium]|nr:50S ribosomal protein L25 [Phycisphaeraceae bacterium]
MTTKQMPRLSTEPRQRIGTRYARRLREGGRLPAVIYGHGQDNLALTVDAEQFMEILHTHAHLVEIDVAGKAEPCLIKDVQWDHLGSQVLHIDLTRVDLTEEVEVDVALALVGEPKALQQAGAVLDHPLTALTILCRADSIPEKITVDIENLELGKSITVADITLPAGVKAVTDQEQLVAQISVVEETVEEPVAAEGAAAEPEVIGKAAATEEEGEAPAEEKK